MENVIFSVSFETMNCLQNFIETTSMITRKKINQEYMGSFVRIDRRFMYWTD